MSVTTAPLVVAILGLGEVSSAIARDLMDADTQAMRDIIVRGCDPAPRGNIAGIAYVSGAVEAVTGSQNVLCANVATVACDVACDVARSVAPALSLQCIFANLNSSTPALKRDMAMIVEPMGALFADIALMAPVPWHGIRTPALAAGSGADQFQATFAPLGMPIELRVASGSAGWLRPLADTAPRYT